MKKTSWLIAILICLLIIGGGAAVVLCPRIVPMNQCSELYKRYANTEGIDATFIKGYRINDTIAVDVTMLEAINDSAWAGLKKEYKIPELTPKQKLAMEKGSPCIAFCGLHEKDKRGGVYTNDNTLVIAMHNDSTIYVFYSKTREHKHAITDMFIDKYYGQ